MALRGESSEWPLGAGYLGDLYAESGQTLQGSFSAAAVDRIIFTAAAAVDRLCRSQIVQINMRLKALAEIYTMRSFAQLCNRNFLSKFYQKFR